MKKIYLTLFILLVANWTFSQTTLFSESFETDGEGTRYTTNTFSLCNTPPGNNNPDYFLRTNTNPVTPPGCTTGFGSTLTNLQGSFFWASEDIRSSSPVPNAFPPGDITTQNINIAGYTSLTVSLYLATGSNNNARWETSDSINIKVSIDGGNFFNVGRFVGDNAAGGRLRIDTDLNGTGDGAAVDQDAFAQYTFNIPGSGSSLKVKLDFDQIGGTEELAIDLIEVKGNFTGGPEINVQGNGANILDGDVTPTTADHTDFGSVGVCTATLDRTFTIQNTGTSNLTISSAAISGTASADYLVITAPASTVAAGGSTTMVVRFNPSTTGARNATITINNNDASEAAYDFAITGTGVEPEINLTGNSVSIVDGDNTPSSADHTDFGSQSACSGNIVRTFTIENTGTGSLSVSSVTITGPNASDFALTALPTNPVGTSSSTTFQITFDPSATGIRSATINVINGDCNEGTYDFAIQGTGTDAEINVQGNSTTINDGDATPSLADHTDFGSQSVCSGTIVRTFTIQNTGTSNLTIGTGDITLTGTNAADYSLSGITLPSTIAAAGSTTFQVTFNPSASGVRNATITIANNDCDEAFYDFSIQGTGTDAEINVQGNSVNILDGDVTPSATDHTDFGSQSVCSGAVTRTFTIQNTGTSSLNFTSLGITGIHAADYSVSSGIAVNPLPAGSTTTFQISFNPSALGARSANIQILSDDCDEATYDFAIQGTGIDPEINVQGNATNVSDGDVTPSSTDHTDFGSQSVCSGSFVRTFTIQNTGTSNLTIAAGAITLSGTNAADYSVGGITLPATITTGANTTFTITFDPSANGSRTATVNIANNDCDETTYDFAIQGTGTDPEINVQGNSTTITDGDATPSSTDHTDFGSQSVCSGTIIRTFTIQNTGTSNLTIPTGAITLSGTNAADFSIGGITLPATIGATGNTTFTVTFNPSANGNRTAIVNIANNDCDEATYDFAIQGTGTDPEINVQGNGTTIPDGDNTPSATDHSDFGSQAVCSGNIVRTFTIQNTGNSNLVIGSGAITLTGANATDFSIGGITLPATILPAGNTVFTVTFDPSATGNRTAIVNIANNDCDEATYDFFIQGTGDPDLTPPTAICQNISVNLDASGNVSILASQINNGSTDDCGIASLNISPNTFTCANIGTNNVTLTVTDNSGNTATCTATVTVNDITSPTVICQNITVNLDGSGNASITSASINNGSSDACGIASLNTNFNSFTCANIGSNPIILTVTDNNGNTATCTAIVNIQDNLAPVPDLAILPTDTGECNVIVSTPTATDNCSGAIMGTTSSPTFYNTQGTYNIVWTYTDAAGNTSTQSQTVIIHDITSPVADIPVLPYILGECDATILTSPTATDNCMGAITGTTTDPLTYSSQGTYIVTWTYYDGNGNSSTQTQTVIIDDMTAPVPDVSSLPTVTAECNATVTVIPTATDNCEGTITGTTTDPLTYSSQGTYTITWTYDDGNGNTATQTQIVIIDDVTDPVADASSLPTITDECSATITVPTATDNCEGTVMGTTTDPLTYSSDGTYTITWTYDDGNGNTSTQTQTVIIDDVTDPVINGMPSNITVNTDPGTCSAIVSWTLPTAFDNCNLQSLNPTSASGSTFSTGTTTVVYTATDAAGNTSTSSFDITVIDNEPPVFNSCPADITACEGSVITYIAPTGTDNCSGTIVSYTGPGSGSIYPVGITTNTYILTDASGNTDTCSFTITINSNPILSFSLPQDTICSIGSTISLSATPASGTFSGNGVSGNQFDPSLAGIGTHIITYSYTDVNGCSNSINDHITVIGCMGIENEIVANNVQVYPNPSNGEFYIEFHTEFASPVQMHILNNLGQTIYKTEFQSKKFYIDIKDFAAGSYTIHLFNNEVNITRKIVLR